MGFSFRKILAGLITVTLIITLIPAFTISGYATTWDEGSFKGAGGQRYVTFGKYNGHDLTWRILNVYESDGNDGNTKGKKTALLVLDDVLRGQNGSAEKHSFTNPGFTSWNNDWDDAIGGSAPGSGLKPFLNNTFLEGAFTLAQRDSILRSPAEGNVWVFVPSVNEINNPQYFTNSAERVAGNQAYWLRSPGGNSRNVAIVTAAGIVDNSGISAISVCPVRPAIKVDASRMETNGIPTVGGKEFKSVSLKVVAPEPGKKPSPKAVCDDANYTAGDVVWTYLIPSPGTVDKVVRQSGTDDYGNPIQNKPPADPPFPGGYKPPLYDIYDEVEVGVFRSSTSHTAYVALTANNGYTFKFLETAFVNGNAAAIVKNTGSMVVLAYEFPKTGGWDLACNMEPGYWTGPGGHRYIEFGRHPDTAAPLRWRVLEVTRGECALLLLDDILWRDIDFDKPISRPDSFEGGKVNNADWNNSYINHRLKNEFFNYTSNTFTDPDTGQLVYFDEDLSAFNNSERQCIIESTYLLGGFSEDQYKKASSHVFLLSAEDTLNKKYFADSTDLSASQHWWLRSPSSYEGINGRYVAYITKDGKRVNSSGMETQMGDMYGLGARPAMWIHLDPQQLKDTPVIRDVSDAKITIPYPIAGSVLPKRVVSHSEGFTCSEITWSPNTGAIAQEETIYTATVTLSPELGYSLTRLKTVSIAAGSSSQGTTTWKTNADGTVTVSLIAGSENIGVIGGINPGYNCGTRTPLYLTMGSYNGFPLVWRVLESPERIVMPRRVLLVLDDVLRNPDGSPEMRSMGTNGEAQSYAFSGINNFLNGPFLGSFHVKDPGGNPFYDFSYADAIIPVDLAPGNPIDEDAYWRDLRGTEYPKSGITEKVFLLSAEDAVNPKYFRNNDDRAVSGVDWWLRTPAVYDYNENGEIVTSRGEAGLFNGVVSESSKHYTSSAAIRPAFWLNVNAFALPVYSQLINGVSATIDAPVTGGTPVSTGTAGGEGYTVQKVEWTPEPPNGKFESGKRYTAKVTLAADGFSTFGFVKTAMINGQMAKVTENTGRTVTLSYTFPDMDSAMRPGDMKIGTWTGPDGQRRMSMGTYKGRPLVWRVLDVYASDGFDGNTAGNKSALLMLDDVLRDPATGLPDVKRFDQNSNSYPQSELNAWLNNANTGFLFGLSAYSGGILNSSYDPEPNPNYYKWNHPYAGEVTGGNSKIFLLSTLQAGDKRYFSGDQDRRAGGKLQSWWLRSPGQYDGLAAEVNTQGVKGNGSPVDGMSGIRPVMKINLSHSSFKDIPVTTEISSLDLAITPPSDEEFDRLGQDCFELFKELFDIKKLKNRVYGNSNSTVSDGIWYHNVVTEYTGPARPIDPNDPDMDDPEELVGTLLVEVRFNGVVYKITMPHKTSLNGYQFTTKLELTADSGYSFTEGMRVTVNGSPAIVEKNDGDKVIISFTFPPIEDGTTGWMGHTWWTRAHRYIDMGVYGRQTLTWRVLEVYRSDGSDGNEEGHRTAVLLLDDLLRTSSGAIEYRAYDNQSMDFTKSSIKKWLNKEFLDNAFDPAKGQDVYRDAILSYDKIDGKAVDPADSKVYLLSKNEANSSRYFSNNGDRQAGWKTYSAPPANSNWYIRTPITPPEIILKQQDGSTRIIPNQTGIGAVSQAGITDGSLRYYEHAGVRPAIKVDLDADVFSGIPVYYDLIDSIDVEVTPPRYGEVQDKTARTKSKLYSTGDVSWSPAPVGGVFSSDVEYTATVEVFSNTGYVFDHVLKTTKINGIEADESEVTKTSLKLSYTFPATESGFIPDLKPDPWSANKRYIELGEWQGRPLVWRVLETYWRQEYDESANKFISKKTALLVLDEALWDENGGAMMRSYDSWTNGFPDSDLERWLNLYFLNGGIGIYRGAVMETEYGPDTYASGINWPDRGATRKGKSKIYLPSYGEAADLRYFENDQERAAGGKEWWLRSPAADPAAILYISGSGSLSPGTPPYYSGKHSESRAVRPMMRVDLSSDLLREVPVFYNSIETVELDVIPPVAGVLPTAFAGFEDSRLIGGEIKWSPELNEGRFNSGETYTATISLETGAISRFAGGLTATVNGQQASVVSNDGRALEVSYTFPETGSEHRIRLEPADNIDFESAVELYGSVAVRTVRIWNIGALATGPLLVALAGDGADGFVLSKNEIGSIPINDIGSFSVAPASGLPPGLYEAKVIVSGETGIEENLDVSFEVIKGDTVIDSVSASVTPPATNQTPDPVASIQDSDPMYAASLEWLPAANTFGAGMQYTARLTFSADEGYRFTDKTSCEINGQVIVPYYVSYYGDEMKALCSFDATKRLAMIELTPAGDMDFGSHRFVDNPYGTDLFPKAVKITSTGISGTGPIQISISGEGKDAFELLTEFGSSSTFGVHPGLDAGKDYTFWIKANNKMPAGLYKALLTVGNNAMGYYGFNLTMDIYGPREALAPEIVTQPKDAIIAAGSPHVLTVEAAVLDDGDLTYQWYKNTIASNEGGTLIEGATKMSYSPPNAVTGTYYYYAEITNTIFDKFNQSPKTATVTSDPATLEIRDVILESIEISAPPLLTSYTTGDMLDLTGLVVTALYSDGRTADVTAGIIADPADGEVLDTAGLVFVDVSYTDEGITKTAMIIVTVSGPAIFDAADPEISSQPSGSTYKQGETASSLTVTANSPDGGTLSYQWYASMTDSNEGGAIINGATGSSYIPLTSDIGTVYYYAVITNTNAAATGKTTAEVTSNTAKVTVIESPAPVLLDSIAVTGYPNKTVYTEGESLDLTGLIVTAYYSDGSSGNVTGSVSTAPAGGTALSASGTQTVTVSYAAGGITKAAEFSVSVREPITDIVLDGIAVTAYPDKTAYAAGETLDLAGMIVTAYYSDGSTGDVTSLVSAVPAEGDVLDVSGVQTVAISFTSGGATKTAEFSIYVDEDIEDPVLDGLAVTGYPNKTSYAVGESLDLSGLIVTAYYSDGSSRDVTSFVTTDPAGGTVLSSAGKQTVTIGYSEEGIVKTCGFSIFADSFVPPVIFDGLAITVYPGKTIYIEGESLDLGGMVVTALYSDGATENVTSLAVTDPPEGTVLDTTGPNTVNVSFTKDGFTKTTGFTVTVNEAPRYGIGLNVSGVYQFASAGYGYAAPPVLSVNISNTGNQATGALDVILDGADKDSFSLSTSIIDSIAVGGFAAFAVQPKGGLAAGTYTATVMVSGANNISEVFGVSFTVNQPKPVTPKPTPGTPSPVPVTPPPAPTAPPAIPLPVLALPAGPVIPGLPEPPPTASDSPEPTTGVPEPAVPLAPENPESGSGSGSDPAKVSNSGQEQTPGSQTWIIIVLIVAAAAAAMVTVILARRRKIAE